MTDWLRASQLVRAWERDEGLTLVAIVVGNWLAMFVTAGTTPAEIFAEHAHSEPRECESERDAVAFAENYAAEWLTRPDNAMGLCECTTFEIGER